MSPSPEQPEDVLVSTSRSSSFNRPAAREGIPPTLEEWSEERGYDPSSREYDERQEAEVAHRHFNNGPHEEVDGGPLRLYIPRDARFDRQERSWPDDALDLNIDHYHGGYGEGMEVRCYECMSQTADVGDQRCTPCRFKWQRRTRGAKAARDDVAS